MEIKIFIVGFGLLVVFFLGTVAYVICTKKLGECWLAIILSTVFLGAMTFGGFQIIRDLLTLSK